MLIYLLQQPVLSMAEQISAMLPSSVRLWLRVLSKTLAYLSPIILGGVIYHFWLEDRQTAAIVLSVILVQQVATIYQEESTAPSEKS